LLELGPLAFASPWILAALALLPLLWWLLRVTPPAPRHIRFPAIRLLFGLESPERTPESSPLWLILLRLAAVTALILALAHPLMNPSGKLQGGGPLILVVDDGWAAASRWPDRQEAMRQAVTRVAREERGVILLTTARADGDRVPAISGVLKPGDARGRIDALLPKPWPNDLPAAAKALEELKPNGSSSVLWLSDSLRGDGTDAFVEALQRFGTVQVVRDDSSRMPHALQASEETDAQLAATVRRAANGGAQRLTVQALAEDGRVLGSHAAEFAPGETEATVKFDVPTEIRNEISRLQIDGEESAAAVALLDERWRRRPVGLASERPLDSGPSLLSETYYVERALRPYSDIRRGPLTELLKSQRAVIIVPDEYVINLTDLDALNAWIAGGGLLLRFAGPRIARDDTDQLTPVRLRRGGRALGGALLWSKPAQLSEFPPESPFVGLAASREVTVSRQVLAEPSLDLAEKTWARLSDGTPLVTTERRDKGRLVLIHTTANAAWTTLPISGLFVDMMRRIVATSRGVSTELTGDRSLPPVETLDGFGRAVPPQPTATAISAREFAGVSVGPSHPPGYYGSGDARQALNLAPQIGTLTPMGGLDGQVDVSAYAASEERDFKPWLLLAALGLFLIDIVATLILRGLLLDALLLRRFRGGRIAGRAAASLLLAAMLVAGAPDSHAQSGSAQDQLALEASESMRLAYVLTGANDVDSVTRSGMTGLTNMLNQRTAVEAGEPMGIDLAADELAFFALIYWPITEDQPTLDEDAVAKLNRYLENGGTILFDTRAQQLSSAPIGGPSEALLRLTRGMSLPALEPIPPDHVLTKAFYLMQEFPGRWSGGKVWVERGDSRTNDGVSRVIIGGHDWASAWAVDNAGRPMFPVVPGGERQREMAYRFGVNLVMYTLTGNYKSDQVHVPAILERLGQ
jgi:hypothetical protein